MSKSAGSALLFGWKKSGFDVLELQYRKLSATLRQSADKSTENVIELEPLLIAPGVPEKFEFRTIYIQKISGLWSPIYPETVGQA